MERSQPKVGAVGEVRDDDTGGAVPAGGGGPWVAGATGKTSSHGEWHSVPLSLAGAELPGSLMGGDHGAEVPHTHKLWGAGAHAKKPLSSCDWATKA